MRRLHIVAPHSDDETIGACAIIGRARRRGIPVSVTVVTDGAGSHRNSKSHPPERLVAMRRRESLNALRLLGVARSAVSFLSLADGSLNENRPDQLYAISRDIRRRPRDTWIVGPSREDEHPDHRMVAQAIRSARRAPGRFLEYDVWGRTNHRPRLCVKVSRYVAVKRAVLSRYKTQCGAITDDPDGFSLTQEDRRRFCRPMEVLY